MSRLRVTFFHINRHKLTMNYHKTINFVGRELNFMYFCNCLASAIDELELYDRFAFIHSFSNSIIIIKINSKFYMKHLVLLLLILCTCEVSNAQRGFRYNPNAVPVPTPPVFTLPSFNPNQKSQPVPPPNNKYKPRKRESTYPCGRCNSTGYYNWPGIANLTGDRATTNCLNCGKVIDVYSSHLCKCRKCNGTGRRVSRY